MPDFLAELSKTAATYPHSLALIAKAGNLDYRSLVEIIESVAGHAGSHGLRGGEIVHVESDNEDMRLLLFLGLMRAGMTVAFLRSAGLALIENGVVPDVVVTDRSEKSALARQAKKVVRFARDWFRAEGQHKKLLPENPDWAVLSASSGSTGLQKLILKGRANREHGIGRRSLDPCYAGDPGDLRYLNGFGESSSEAFSYFITTLTLGGAAIRLRDYSPDEIVGATCLLRPSYVCVAPMILVNMLNILDAAPRRFRKADYLRLSGAFCAPDIQQKALDLYADNVFTAYGSTEIGQIASGSFVDIRKTEGSVGWIDEGLAVETVDDRGQTLPQGAEGEIRVRPPAQVVTHYLTGDGATDVLRDGWFYPGDIGRVDGTGQLIITGRKSAVINLGGNKINPETAESVLLGFAGVEDVAVAPVPGRHGFQTICALVVTAKTIELDDVNRFLRDKGARFWVDRLKLVREIPRGANRKIDRPAVREIANEP